MRGVEVERRDTRDKSENRGAKHYCIRSVPKHHNERASEDELEPFVHKAAAQACPMKTRRHERDEPRARARAGSTGIASLCASMKQAHTVEHASCRSSGVSYDGGRDGGITVRDPSTSEYTRPLEPEALQPAQIQQLRDGRLAHGRARVGLRRALQRRRRRREPGDLLFLGHDEALRGHLAPADDALVREQRARGLDVAAHGGVAGKVLSVRARQAAGRG